MIRIAMISVAILASTAALAQSPYYNQGRWRGNDNGAAIIGGMIGGFLGGMIAPRPTYYAPPPVYYQAPQPQYMQQYSDAQLYCMQRFRSYDPRSGYFTGYDGRLHSCP